MARKYFDVQNNGEHPVILVYGSIPDVDWNTWDDINRGSDLVQAIKTLEKTNNRIDIRLNSPGGDFFDGLAVANAIAQSSAEVNTYVDGIAYSAAFLIFAAGKKRYAAQGAFLMAHNASYGRVSGNAKELFEASKELETYDEQAVKILASASNMEESRIKDEFYSYTDVVMTSDKALENGFVDEILPFRAENIPQNIENLTSKQVYAFYEGKEVETVKTSWVKNITQKITSAFKAKPKNGQSLANALNQGIEALETEQRTRQDIISEMATAAGIEPGTVNQILNGSINCPPLERLEGFSSVLDISTESLTEAAAADGCSYEPQETNNTMKNFNNIFNLAGLAVLMALTSAAKSEDLEKLDGKIGEIQNKLTESQKEKEALKAANESLKAEIEALKAQPAANASAPVKNGTEGSPAEADGVNWDAIDALPHNRKVDSTL